MFASETKERLALRTLRNLCLKRVVMTALILCMVVPAWAKDDAASDARDPIDVAGLFEAAKELPDDEVADFLERALAKSIASAHAVPAAKIRRALANRYLRRGEVGIAVEYYELLTTSDAKPHDLIELGAARLAVAQEEAGLGGQSVVVVPSLLDAVDATSSLDPSPQGGLEPADRARLALTRAEVFKWLGQHAKAAALFRTADPASFDEATRPLLWDRSARAHHAAREYEGAAKAFAQAKNIRGEAAAWAAAKNRIQTLRVYAQLLRNALANASKEHAAPAKSTQPWKTVADEAFRSVRYVQGFAELDKVISTLTDIPPSHQASVLQFHAKVKEARGDAQATQILLRKALPLAIEHGTPSEVATIRMDLGRALVAVTGDQFQAARTEAVGQYLEALKEPSTRDVAAYVLRQLAGTYDSAMWYDEMAATHCLRIQKALASTFPDDLMIWANYGNSLRRAGKTDLSLRAYDKARAIDAEDPVVLSDWGLALGAAGRMDDALKAFEQSVEVDDSHLAGFQNASRQHWLLGRFDQAEMQLARAIKQAREERRNPETYRFLWEQVWRTRRRLEVK